MGQPPFASSTTCPTFEPEKLFVKPIREPFCPGCVFLAKVAGEQALECGVISEGDPVGEDLIDREAETEQVKLPAGIAGGGDEDRSHAGGAALRGVGLRDGCRRRKPATVIDSPLKSSIEAHGEP